MSPRYLSTMSYLLTPSADDMAAIRATLADYAVMMGILDELGRERGASANLVALHEQARGHGGGMALIEIVVHDDFVAGLQQVSQAMRPDVPRAARHQNSHRCPQDRCC